MKHTKLVVSGLAVAGLAAVVWFALPDDAQNAVKDTLGITQSAPTATAHAPGRTLDQVLTDWGKDTRMVINGHNVPPMPDPKINNATIAGVDSDNDGIRDDIDRYIAENFGNDPRYDAIVREEKQLQVMLISPTKENGKLEMDELDCAVPFSLSDKQFHELVVRMDRLTHFTVNTNARGGAYAMALAGSNKGRCPRK